ncbi:MAG: diguanylate cyclase (GGDEF)-like protein [Gammaproteobacteria bacterium]|jgi:diguanylate cyclase (GGDEF)-like protein
MDMTLKRQLSLMASALILLLLIGNLFVTLTNSSNYFQQQLNARAYDAATSLALSMSNAVADGDKVKLERMIDVLFDRGFFSEISLQLVDGSELERRAEHGAHTKAAPTWFINFVDMAVIPAHTDVTQGWQRLGSLTVQSNTDSAYRDLWNIVRGEVVWFLWMALISLVSLQIILRWMFKPLERVEQQALDISERNLYEQEKLPRARELRRVVLAMNQMVRKLKAIFAEQSAITEKLREESYHDDVSQLLNRRGFDQRLQHILQESDGYSGVLVLLQVQDFSQFNQEQGREAGDELLFRVGEILNQWHCEHSNALISRRTGADFSLYIPATDLLHSEELVEQCFNLLSTTALSQRGGMNFHIGALFIQRSLIIEGTHVDVPVSLVDVLSKADVALRQAQTQHISRYGFYEKANEEVERTAGEWKLMLEKVLQEESIELHYQPILDARGEDVLHFEVLSRIRDQQGVISAARFWPMVERHQLTPNFDLLVIKTLLEQLQASSFINEGTRKKFCINLSAASILYESFHDQLEILLDQYPQWRELLCIEISEFSISHIESPLARLAHRLKSKGVDLGIDQVGTGSLAFAYLQRLPLSYLRIAGSFNRGLHLALDHKFFIQSMVQIAHNLDLQVLGEGVENRNDIEALKQTGVDGMGGYYFTPPINGLDAALSWKVSSTNSDDKH